MRVVYWPLRSFALLVSVHMCVCMCVYVCVCVCAQLSYETPSVLQLSDDAHRVWHKDGDTAMGARDCRYIPIKDMVRFRCVRVYVCVCVCV